MASFPSDAPGADDGLWSFLRTLLAAAVIAIVFRAVLFEPFSIPSGSMVPTLLTGDYLFVSKWTYGYSARSVGLGFVQDWFGVELPKGRFPAAPPPRRGDVVVFKLPRDGATDYVKRLIGLPGDEIQIRGGRLSINGKLVPRAMLGAYDVGGDDLERDHPYFRRMFRMEGRLYRETLPEGRPHPILEMTDQGRLDDTRVYTVPEGHYFMLGDNRDNSQDSRVQNRVGLVPREYVVGRAEIIFFSLKAGTPFWAFWEWPAQIRLKRFFKVIS